MKTSKVNYLSVAARIAFCSMLLVRCPVLAQAVAPATTPANLQQEKMEVKGLINAVKFERNRIASLNKKYKADKTSGNETAVREDRKQLVRADGDLQMAKAYLKAEKSTFVEDYDLAIQAQREAVRNDRRMLAAATVKLGNDLAAIDEKSDQDARAVVRCEQSLANDKVVLSLKIVERNSDILALNKQIKKENGEFVGSLYVENAAASTQNLFEK